jgi:hypothetical protein
MYVCMYRMYELRIYEFIAPFHQLGICHNNVTVCMNVCIYICIQMYTNSVFVNIACTSSMKGCKFGNNIRVGFDNSAKMFNFFGILKFCICTEDFDFAPTLLTVGGVE